MACFHLCGTRAPLPEGKYAAPEEAKEKKGQAAAMPMQPSGASPDRPSTRRPNLRRESTDGVSMMTHSEREKFRQLMCTPEDPEQAQQGPRSRRSSLNEHTPRTGRHSLDQHQHQRRGSTGAVVAGTGSPPSHAAGERTSAASAQNLGRGMDTFRSHIVAHSILLAHKEEAPA